MDNEEIQIVDGFEVEDTSSVSEVKITVPFDPTKIRISTKPTTMGTIITRLKTGGIDLSPDFQRSSVWKPKNKSRLIESLLLRIPLPAFYFDASNESCWVVIDGLQRLTAIKEYVVNHSYTLSDLEFLTQFEGKQFSELPSVYQRRIEEADVFLFLVDSGTPERVKFDIFRRINTGGEPLSMQEIRHALNPGPIKKFLKDMAESNEFVIATAYGVSASRMADRECVLRFLAFFETAPEKYGEGDIEDFDSFLNDYMRRFNAQAIQHSPDALAEKFKTSLILATELFSDCAFRKYSVISGKRAPINKALFEAWMVNLAQLSAEEQGQLVERKYQVSVNMDALLINPDFIDSISQSTASKRKIIYRFSSIRKLVQEVLYD